MTDKSISPVNAHVLMGYVQFLKAQKNGPEYMELLSTKIVPLLRCLFRSKCTIWENEYSQSYKSFEVQALEVINQTINIIRQRVCDARLNDSRINTALCIIESIKDFRYTKLPIGRSTKQQDAQCKYQTCSDCHAPLQDHAPSLLPSYAMSLYDKVCSLCAVILEVGHEALVADFIEVKVTSWCYEDQQNNRTECTQRYIDRYTFAPKYTIS